MSITMIIVISNAKAIPTTIQTECVGNPPEGEVVDRSRLVDVLSVVVDSSFVWLANGSLPCVTAHISVDPNCSFSI